MAKVCKAIAVTLPRMYGLTPAAAEQLRYAGLINFEKEDLQPNGLGNEVVVSFKMYPPASIQGTRASQEVWARRNAERIKSFGFGAEIITF